MLGVTRKGSAIVWIVYPGKRLVDLARLFGQLLLDARGVERAEVGVAERVVADLEAVGRQPLQAGRRLERLSPKASPLR